MKKSDYISAKQGVPSFVFAFAFFLGMAIPSTVRAQTVDCDNTAGGELTIRTSCITIPFNSTNNTDYWDLPGEEGYVSVCGEFDLDDAWMWFDAVSNTTTITYASVSSDPVLVLFEGTVCSPTMVSYACSNNFGAGSGETIVATTVPGRRYHIRIQRYGSNANMNGSICAVRSIDPATLATGAVTVYDQVSATMGGEITSDGGAAVTERGVVFSTSVAPTTGDNKVQIGSGTGTFSQSIPGLDPSTTYHVRTYAINSIGTSYGNEVSFTTDGDATTQVSPWECGSTIEYLNTEYIDADPVAGAEQYEFRITSGAYTATATDDLVSGKVRILQFAGYQYNTTYEIDVRVKVSGIWTAYGPSCIISTTAFPHSEIDAAQCGTTLAAMNTYIYTSSVNGATQYRFRIVNGANVQTIDRPSRSFNMTMLASYEYGTTYTIDMAVEFNGAWNPYSTACNITTPSLPTSQITASQCATTLPTLGTTINANAVAGATQYRFRLVNGAEVQTIEKTTPSFKMTELASYSFSTSYTIDVAVMYNGTFQPYGAACNVTTPAPASIPTTKIQASQCGTSLASISTYFYATAVSSATQYRFRLTENGNTQIFDNPTRAINLTMIPVHKTNTTYAVEVAVMVNGSWGAYGASCNITSPAVYSRVKAAQCGTTLVKINKVIYADEVEYATSYRFRVTEGANVQTIDRTVNTFMLPQLALSAYGTTYTIDVAIQVNGAWGAYGAACNISTPSGMASRMGNAVMKDKAPFEALAFPNPFADAFGVRVITSSTAMIMVTIYDMAGKLMSEQTVAPQETDTFNAGIDFAAGMYQVRVVQGDEVRMLRVVKN